MCGLSKLDFMIICREQIIISKASHHTITKLLKVIESKQASNEILIEQASIGIDISRSNNKYDAIDDKTESICSS